MSLQARISIFALSFFALFFAQPAYSATVSGTVSPAIYASGATVRLKVSSTIVASTTVDANGAYSFTGVANGSYTVKPVKTNYKFSPFNKSISVNGADVTGVNFTIAPRGYAISGTITGGSGATVTLSGASAATTVADANGNYSFANLASGSFTVTPSSSGKTYSPASRAVTINGASVTGVNFATLYTISGTISGSGGPGSTVALSGAKAATTTADVNGNYKFANLAPGSYTVQPSKSGFTFTPTSQSFSIISNNHSGVNFTAVAATSPTYSISGTITGGAGATVNLSGAAAATVTADASGNYSFPNLVNGTYAVTPSLSGKAFTPSSQSATVNGANITGLNFTASSTTYTLSGNISGGAGSTVTLGGAKSATATADSSGNYSFASLANGTYTVTPSKTGYSFSPTSQSVAINGANLTTVNFTATAVTYSISGTVTGGPGATVALSGSKTASTTADSTGKFTFTGVPNGTFTVTPTLSGYSISPTSQSVTVNSANVTSVNFTATASAHYVDLSWVASTSTGVTGYNVYRSSTSGGPYTKINTALVSALTYRDSSVTAGATYYYVITAVSSTGSESGYSNQAQATIPTP